MRLPRRFAPRNDGRRETLTITGRAKSLSLRACRLALAKGRRGNHIHLYP